MGGSWWKRTRVAAVAGAVLAGGVLVGGVLVGGVALAQTPGQTERPRQHAGMQMQRGEHIQQLAAALGKTPEEVEQAFRQVAAQRAPAVREQRAEMHGRVLQLSEERLAAAAAQLNVTPEQLRQAIRAAAQMARPNLAPGEHLDRGARFAAIAQQLGGGITAAQVQAALGEAHAEVSGQRRMVRTEGGQPGRMVRTEGGQSGPILRVNEERLAAAAAQLNVTPEQLRQAIQAAMQAARQHRTPGERPDRQAHFAAIAQQLGGVTAAQVQAALGQVHAETGQQRRMVRAEAGEQRLVLREEGLQALAAALGVTEEQLRAALRSLRP